MKRFYFWVVAAFLAASLLVGVAANDTPKALVKPAPVTITPTDRQAITDAYQQVVNANKDLQIAILRARVAAKVDETWPINLQTMEFEPPKPPAAPVEKK